MKVKFVDKTMNILSNILKSGHTASYPNNNLCYMLSVCLNKNKKICIQKEKIIG